MSNILVQNPFNPYKTIFKIYLLKNFIELHLFQLSPFSFVYQNTLALNISGALLHFRLTSCCL